LLGLEAPNLSESQLYDQRENGAKNAEHSLRPIAPEAKTRTRRFAKRRGTWFRSLIESRFVDVVGEVDAKKLAHEIARQSELG
jgi:tRNA A37 N6-isopentenylltransferase MiaA